MKNGPVFLTEKIRSRDRSTAISKSLSIVGDRLERAGEIISRYAVHRKESPCLEPVERPLEQPFFRLGREQVAFRNERLEEDIGLEL